MWSLKFLIKGNCFHFCANLFYWIILFCFSVLILVFHLAQANGWGLRPCGRFDFYAKLQHCKGNWYGSGTRIAHACISPLFKAYMVLLVRLLNSSYAYIVFWTDARCSLSVVLDQCYGYRVWTEHDRLVEVRYTEFCRIATQYKSH